MEWEKRELEEQIESNIDFWWQKMEFAKSLLVMLQEAPAKESFMSSAMSQARGYYDPWVRDELCSFVDNLDCC